MYWPIRIKNVLQTINEPKLLKFFLSKQIKGAKRALCSTSTNRKVNKLYFGLILKVSIDDVDATKSRREFQADGRAIVSEHSANCRFWQDEFVAGSGHRVTESSDERRSVIVGTLIPKLEIDAGADPCRALYQIIQHYTVLCDKSQCSLSRRSSVMTGDRNAGPDNLRP